MVEWTENSAIRELEDAGAVFVRKAFKQPEALTARLLTAIDYLVNQCRYYRR